MIARLWWLWLQLWPNLIADAIAGAAAWAAHNRFTKRHTAAVHQRLDAMHARLEAQRQHNLSETHTAADAAPDPRRPA